MWLDDIHGKENGIYLTKAVQTIMGVKRTPSASNLTRLMMKTHQSLKNFLTNVIVITRSPHLALLATLAISSKSSRIFIDLFHTLSLDTGKKIQVIFSRQRIPVKLNSDSGACEHHFRKGRRSV